MRNHTQSKSIVRRPTAPDTKTSLCREIGACVYFIRERDGLVKIGWTTDLASRKRAFGSGWEHILAVVPGTTADEAALHERFAADLRRGREYFRPSAALLAHINDIRRDCGVEALSA